VAGTAGGNETYTYDDRDHLLSGSGPVGNAAFTYTGDGTLASRNDAAGNATFAYDGAGRLTSVTEPLTGHTLSYGYTNGQPTSRLDRATVAVRAIAYDTLGRVTSDAVKASATSSTTLYGNTYRYDADDNLTGKDTTTSAGLATNNYGYDGANRLTSWV